MVYNLVIQVYLRIYIWSS